MINWDILRPHYGQSCAYRSNAKIVALACGRGSGKTMIMKRKLVRQLPIRKRWSDPIYFYGMPTYKQAKRVAWNDLIKLVPRNWLARDPNVSEMCIETVFGSKLYVVGLDKPQRVEGSQWDAGVIDESSDQKLDEFLDSGLMPTLSHRDGWLGLIGIPKRYGVGARKFKEIFDKGLNREVYKGSNRVGYESYTWKSNTVLTEEQLEFYRKCMDPRDYDEQFDAAWVKIGGAIFHSFSKETNVRDDIQYNPNLPICVTSDFNVNPMSWCLAHIIRGKIYVFDELFIRNTNTPDTLDILWERYKEHRSGFRFYGDATGQARHASAVFTDYAYIHNDERFDIHVKKRVFYIKNNPPRADRFASCNAMFLSKSSDVRCFIASKCLHLIDDFSVRSYKKGSREPDDSGDIGHMSDAFGYMAYREFPVRIKLNLLKPKVSSKSIPLMSA